MTDIGKFLSDVQKILKHDRQNNSGKSDYSRVKDDLRNLFEHSTTCPGELPGSVYEYWESEYIYSQIPTENDPVEEYAGKLGAFLAFLDNSDEDQNLINEKDWNELAQLVNYEAEELPVDVLQDLMMILVSKGAY